MHRLVASPHRAPLVALAAAALAAPLVLGRPLLGLAQTPTPTVGVVEEAQFANLPTCAPSEIGGVPEGLEPAATFAIVPEESAARC